MQVGTGPVTIMGCSSFTSEKGVTYYNVDIYDSNAGEMYRCGCTYDVFNNVLGMQKPASVKSVTLDIDKQWKGQSRIDIIGWK